MAVKVSETLKTWTVYRPQRRPFRLEAVRGHT